LIGPEKLAAGCGPGREGKEEEPNHRSKLEGKSDVIVEKPVPL